MINNIITGYKSVNFGHVSTTQQTDNDIEYDYDGEFVYIGPGEDYILRLHREYTDLKQTSRTDHLNLLRDQINRAKSTLNEKIRQALEEN